jgi:hypothetical protein
MTTETLRAYTVTYQTEHRYNSHVPLPQIYLGYQVCSKSSPNHFIQKHHVPEQYY